MVLTSKIFHIYRDIASGQSRIMVDILRLHRYSV
nr:MAG TPA: hypothetical protein [Caudoviricetes sp.]